MTVKEIADLLEVSKPTVSKAIKALDIPKIMTANRYEIESKNLEIIIKYIHPKDFQKYFEKAKENEKAETDNGKSEINFANSENESQTGENPTAKAETGTAKPQNEKDSESDSVSQTLINLLREQIREKDNLILEQQHTINNLANANTMLTLRLEELRNPQEEDIINQPDTDNSEQETTKKKWWQRLLGI